MYIGFSFSYM